MKLLRKLRPAVLLASGWSLLLILSACSVLPRPEPVDVYRLPPAQWSSSAAEALPLSLRIGRPSASAALAGVRLVVIPDGDRLSIYQGASWTDPAPVLVRERLLEAFRADGRIAALSSDEFRLQADYEIVSDLLAFHSEYHQGRPEVVVTLEVRLVRSMGRRIVASRQFSLREPAPGKEVEDIVSGLGQISTALSAQVVHWTLAELERCADGNCAVE